MTKAVQAKHIADTDALDAVRRCGAAQPSGWAVLLDVQAVLSAFPPKVVRAKLAALVRRGVLNGCACGCRGDFYIKPESQVQP